jgi:hypothetical protein
MISPHGALRTLALCLWLSGCAALVHKPFTSPANGGPAWTEVTSAHFVVATDLDGKAALRVSSQLEAMFSALSDLGFPSADKPKTKMHVVYFQRREEYVTVAPRLSGAIFKTVEGYDFESEPLAIVQGDLVERKREELEHELTHFFVQYYYPQAPVWLSEGLAQYFGTLVTEGGKAMLGRLPLGDRFWKGPWKMDCGTTGCTTLVPMSEASRVRDLVAMRGAEFYGNQNADPMKWEGPLCERVQPGASPVPSSGVRVEVRRVLAASPCRRARRGRMARYRRQRPGREARGRFSKLAR